MLNKLKSLCAQSRFQMAHSFFQVSGSYAARSILSISGDRCIAGGGRLQSCWRGLEHASGSKHEWSLGFNKQGVCLLPDQQYLRLCDTMDRPFTWYIVLSCVQGCVVSLSLVLHLFQLQPHFLIYLYSTSTLTLFPLHSLCLWPTLPCAIASSTRYPVVFLQIHDAKTACYINTTVKAYTLHTHVYRKISIRLWGALRSDQKLAVNTQVSHSVALPPASPAACLPCYLQ